MASYTDSLPEIELILSHLVSQDNNIRSQNEHLLNTVWVVQRPHLLLPALVHLIGQHQDPAVRSFACVLFRRLAFKEMEQATQENENNTGVVTTPYMVVGSDVRNFCETGLLKSLEMETDPSVRKKVNDTISELAQYMSLHGTTWTELLPTIFKCIQSSSEHFRESALAIIASSPELILDQDVNFVKSIFTQLLQDPSAMVQVSAVKANCYYLIRVPKAIRNAMADTLPLMIQSFIKVSSAPDLIDSAINQLSYLIELAEYHAKMFKPIAADLVNLVASIMKNEELDTGIRQTALELLLSILECATIMMRKNTQVAEVLIPILLEWMGKIEDDEDWYTADDIEDVDNEDDNILAQQGLDRFAQALGGKNTLPIVYSTVPVMMSSSAWQHRHAGLYAISSIAEGCVALMETQLQNVLEMIARLCKDEHPRVRYAACNALGQLCTDFAPKIQKEHADLILQHLIPILDENKFPRVQAHAAAALVNFFEDAKKSQVAPYLDQVVPKLAHLLRYGKLYLQEQAATTIATAAECGKDLFIKFYPEIVPLLIEILRQPNVKEYRTLKSRAIESVSLIALAVGKKIVSPHAVDILNMFQEIQQSITDPADPQSSFLLGAWARMCSVLKQDFVPYLDYVMQPLLKSARLQADFTVFDADDDTSAYSEEEGWELVQVEGKKYGIKTSVLEEKSTAIEMFICYAKEMGGAFSGYVKDVLSIVLPLTKFYLHDGVRFAAVTTIPLLLSCLKDTPQAAELIAPLWDEISNKLLDAINIEPDEAFISHLLISYHETIEILGSNCLSPTQMERITNLIIEQAQRFIQNIRDREESKKAGEIDDDDEEQLLDAIEQDENTLGELSRVINVVFNAQGEFFLPYFENLLPILNAFKTEKNSACRQWAICAYDDLIEYCSEKAWVYKNHFGPLFIQGLEDPSVEVRQATCYGVGVCGQVANPEYKPLIEACLPLLGALIQHPQARTEENIVCTENAISALGKICHYSPDVVNLNEMIPFWVNALPIVHDEAETEHTYSYFLELLESPFAPSILGEGHQNLPKVVQILGSALFTKSLSSELDAQVRVALQSAIRLCPAEGKEMLWNQLPTEQQQYILECKLV